MQVRGTITSPGWQTGNSSGQIIHGVGLGVGVGETELEQKAAPTLKPFIVLQPGPPKFPLRPSLEPQIGLPNLHIGVPFWHMMLRLLSQVGLVGSSGVGVGETKSEQKAVPTLKPFIVLQPGPLREPLNPNLEPQMAVPLLQVGVPLAQVIISFTQVGPLPPTGVAQ